MELNLLIYSEKLKRRNTDGKTQIWDIIRSKWIALTPEEMVRQCLIMYLIEEKKISKNRIAIEREIILGLKRKRFDVVIYDNDLKIEIAIECKSPDIKLDEKVISQIVRYNQVLDSRYLWVVNGVEGMVMEKENSSRWIEIGEL